MSTWHYLKENQKLGPVSTEELKALLASGQLSPATMVWKEGFPNWVAVNTQPELTVGPPPIPTQGGGPSHVDSNDIEANKVMAILAYLGILFIVPILAARQSKFAMYHTNQGLILFLTMLIICVGLTILGFIPFVGWIVYFLGFSVVPLGIFIFAILGIINAAKGECKPLPLIGDSFTLIK